MQPRCAVEAPVVAAAAAAVLRGAVLAEAFVLNAAAVGLGVLGAPVLRPVHVPAAVLVLVKVGAEGGTAAVAAVPALALLLDREIEQLPLLLHPLPEGRDDQPCCSTAGCKSAARSAAAAAAASQTPLSPPLPLTAAPARMRRPRLAADGIERPATATGASLQLPHRPHHHHHAQRTVSRSPAPQTAPPAQRPAAASGCSSRPAAPAAARAPPPLPPLRRWRRGRGQLRS